MTLYEFVKLFPRAYNKFIKNPIIRSSLGACGKNFVIGNSNITNDELHIIVKSLLLMQSKGTDCSSLIRKLASNSLLKEIENESFNEERKWAL